MLDLYISKIISMHECLSKGEIYKITKKIKNYKNEINEVLSDVLGMPVKKFNKKYRRKTIEWKLSNIGRLIEDKKIYKKLASIKAKYFRERNKLICSNLRLVWSIALKHYNNNLEKADYFGEGIKGLICAINHYDPDRGYCFSTYATQWINSAIKRAIDESSLIKIPVNLLWKFRAYEDLCRKTGKKLSAREFAKKKNISIGEAKKVITAHENLMRSYVSLNTLINEDENMELIDTLSDDSDYEKAIDKRISRNTLNSLIEEYLSLREKKIIKMRLGLDGESPSTFQEIGNKFNFSRQRAKQLQEKVFKELYKIIKKQDLITNLEYLFS